MKKIFLLAAAAVAAMTLYSCKESDEIPTETVSEADLTIKINMPATTNPSSSTASAKSIQVPGSSATGTIRLRDNSGYVFILGPSGNVIYKEALAATARTTAGQTLTQKIANNSRVYVVANVPSDAYAALQALTTWTDIQNYASAILTQQADYRTVALANSDGAPMGITVSGTTATANIALNPLVSRIELVAVQGGANPATSTTAYGPRDSITAFTVTGVWLTDYAENFTYDGRGSGTVINVNQDLSPSTLRDENTAPGWAATVNAQNRLRAIPYASATDTARVWAYEVPAGGLPRLIIRLSNIRHKTPTGTEQTIAGNKYLTIAGYQGVSSFRRGTIYRIGTDATSSGSGTVGSSALVFTPDNLGDTPNASNQTNLTVNVHVVEWVIETPTAILQ